MQCHGLRKFFSTTASTEGLKPLYIEMLMGHKIGLTGVYFRPKPIDLLEGNDKMFGYASIINSLTISEENRLRQEVQKLSVTSKDNENLIRTKLEEREEEIEILKQGFNKEMMSIRKEIMKDVKSQIAELVTTIKPEIIKEGTS